MRTRAWVQRRAIIAWVTDMTPPDDLRVSDAERAQVQDRLRRAHDVGQLDLAEFDDRVRTVWAARTRGELARITADLPEPPSEPARPGVFSSTPGGVTMRVLTTVWIGVVTLNLVIWGILALTTGEAVYPWWLWVAGPPGAVLAVLYAAGIGRPRR
jgi:hypothetical protein